MTKTMIALAGLLLAVALASACEPTATRGGEGTDNPELDTKAMGVGLDKVDLDYMAGKCMDALLRSRFWIQHVKGRPQPPLMAIWPIENHTTQHLGDEMTALLSSLETTLVNSGDVHMVARARQEQLTRELGLQRGAAYDPTSARKLGRQLGVEYFLTGKLTSVDERLGSKRRAQYTLFLQVLELETGLVKFQQEASRSKEISG